MSDKFFHFSLNHHGFALELRLNDVIIDTDPKGLFKNRKFINNQFIIDGTNTVSLRLSLAGNPPILPKELTLTCAVRILDESQLGSDNLPEPVLLLSFPGSQVPTFPVEINGTFETKSPFIRWQWQDAETVSEITPEMLGECGHLLSQLHGALSDKNFAEVQRLTQIKTSEMANAFYISMENRTAGQNQFFTDVFNDSKYAMEPFKADDLELVQMANKKLFLIRHTGDTPALESAELSEGYCFTLPVYVSRINGKWEIVR